MTAPNSTRPVKPVTKRLRELVGPDWTPEEKVIEQLTPLVRPGHAIRRARLKSGSESERIYSGAREIVRDSIANDVYNGYAEREKRDGVAYLRLRPENPQSLTGRLRPPASSAPLGVILRPQFPQWDPNPLSHVL